MTNDNLLTGPTLLVQAMEHLANAERFIIVSIVRQGDEAHVSLHTNVPKVQAASLLMEAANKLLADSGIPTGNA